jgi:DNA-binding XRE family transcriptional regulator
MTKKLIKFEKRVYVEKRLSLVKKTANELGITQGELGNLIGVSRATINNWNNGNSPIPKWGENSMNMLVELKELRVLKNSLKSLLKSDRNILLSLNN